jgi:hypothetical protein
LVLVVVVMVRIVFFQTLLRLNANNDEKKKCRALAKEMKGVNDQLDKHIIEENLTSKQLKDILILAVGKHRSANELLGKADGKSGKAKSEAESKKKGKK